MPQEEEWDKKLHLAIEEFLKGFKEFFPHNAWSILCLNLGTG